MARILLIDDDPAVASELQDLLQQEGFEAEATPDVAQGLARARSQDFDVVVTDLHLPGPFGEQTRQGLNVLKELHLAKPHLPVILMTGHHTTEMAIQATKLGAFDYILKPIDPPEFLHMVGNAARNKEAASEPVEIGDARTVKEAIIGTSRAMQEVYKEIGRVAATTVTVLIRGATGTGKELVARALYHYSARADQPFIVVNCAALPETLLESELFGHEPGAFTDARLRRIGRFEQADGGTIFLDEIGDISLSTQVKLLRVLQERTVQRLGGKEIISVDVRILAATHRDLESGIQEGAFRSDLYFRINEAVIRLPPLSERLEDIPELADYFLQRESAKLGLPKPALDAGAIECLQEAPWPGNVRQLKSVLGRVLLQARGRPLTRELVQTVLDYSKPVPSTTSAVSPAGSAEGTPAETVERPFAERVAELLEQAQSGAAEKIEGVLTEEVERELYGQAIQLARGNQSQAARWLGVSRPTLREKLALFNLQPGSGGQAANELCRADPRLLIVEDDPAFAELLETLLEDEGCQVEIATAAEPALARALKDDFDVVLADLYLGGLGGLELIQRLQATRPHLPVILMTGQHSTETTIKAMQCGAYEYFIKPDVSSFVPSQNRWDWVTQLSKLIDQAVASRRARQAVGLPDETTLGLDEKRDQILGKSRVMREVYKEIGRVAATAMTVLIRGETGTGKELVARALYHHSGRIRRPFLVVNCAALPETLLESELFGHEPGAFTDAKFRRIGRFEQAHGGTLFLDEIGDLSVSTQVKLLRVLQEKTVQRLGGKEIIPVDVRILAATHRDLELGIQEGTFRPDLFFRINHAVIRLPPLRERAGDVPELAAYFVQRDGLDLGWPSSVLLPEAIQCLEEQPWPGNVRQLRNVLRRALLQARGYPITAAHIRRALSPAAWTPPGANSIYAAYIGALLARARRGLLERVEAIVRECLERDLYGQAIALAGDQSQAAKWLGVSRPTIREKLAKYALAT